MIAPTSQNTPVFTIWLYYDCCTHWYCPNLWDCSYVSNPSTFEYGVVFSLSMPMDSSFSIQPGRAVPVQWTVTGMSAASTITVQLFQHHPILSDTVWWTNLNPTAALGATDVNGNLASLGNGVSGSLQVPTTLSMASTGSYYIYIQWCSQGGTSTCQDSSFKSSYFSIPVVSFPTTFAGTSYNPGSSLTVLLNSAYSSDLTVSINVCQVGLIFFTGTCTSGPSGIDLPAAGQVQQAVTLPLSGSLFPFMFQVQYSCTSLLGISWCSTAYSDQFLIVSATPLYSYNYNQATNSAIQSIPLFKQSCASVTAPGGLCSSCTSGTSTNCPTIPCVACQSTATTTSSYSIDLECSNCYVKTTTNIVTFQLYKTLFSVHRLVFQGSFGVFANVDMTLSASYQYENAQRVRLCQIAWHKMY